MWAAPDSPQLGSGIGARRAQWQHEQRLRRSAGRYLPAAAGAVTGLAFTTKQDIGIYSLTLLLATLAAISLLDRAAIRQVRDRLASALAAFCATLLVVLLPILVTGGARAYFDQGFGNKGTYAELGRVPCSEGLSALRYSLSGINSPASLAMSSRQRAERSSRFTCVDPDRQRAGPFGQIAATKQCVQTPSGAPNMLAGKNVK